MYTKILKKPLKSVIKIIAVGHKINEQKLIVFLYISNKQGYFKSKNTPRKVCKAAH